MKNNNVVLFVSGVLGAMIMFVLFAMVGCGSRTTKTADTVPVAEVATHEPPPLVVVVPRLERHAVLLRPITADVSQFCEDGTIGNPEALELPAGSLLVPPDKWNNAPYLK